MNSIDPKHTEPTSGNQQGAEEHSGPCSSESLTGHVDPAIVEKPALDTATMNLMEQIVDPANLDCAWERVKANRSRVATDDGACPDQTGSQSTRSPTTFETTGRNYGNNSWMVLTNPAPYAGSRFQNPMAASDISAFQTCLIAWSSKPFC